MAPHHLVQRRSVVKQLGLSALATVVSPTFGARAAKQPAPAANPLGSRADSAVRGIYMNQVGYLPDRQKRATVILEVGSPPQVPFQVKNSATGDIVFEGILSPATFDAHSGDILSQAEFSDLRAVGSYRIETLGTAGDVFAIAPAIYAPALRLVARSFYGQRCGCKVDLGDGYRHDQCHSDGIFGISSGRKGKVVSAGGWHDAGDYGRYVVNSGITCGTLLWAWEMFPDALRTLHLEIPESGNSLPDFLAEVRWNLNWMLQMQDPTDGGVWHKQTSSYFCGFILPEQDRLPSEIIGTGSEPYKSTCATADFAAVMAIASRCYAPYDKSFAASCLSVARHAFQWASANPNIIFRNPTKVTTGEYGDAQCADEILWAAAELFRTTREPVFRQSVLASIASLPSPLVIQAPSWGSITSMGLWAYAFAHAKPSDETAKIQQATNAAAALLIRRSAESGYGHTLGERDYGWGSNSTAANQSLLLLVANRFDRNPDAVEAALANLHYLLGRNCFGVAWVTHLGLRPFLHPHHRPSVADGIIAPWPGLLSGGPNAHGGDRVADRLPPAPPMRMWTDDNRAYSLNEVAINWNAPLVFLLAAASSTLTRL